MKLDFLLVNTTKKSLQQKKLFCFDGCNFLEATHVIDCKLNTKMYFFDFLVYGWLGHNLSCCHLLFCLKCYLCSTTVNAWSKYWTSICMVFLISLVHSEYHSRLISRTELLLHHPSVKWVTLRICESDTRVWERAIVRCTWAQGSNFFLCASVYLSVEDSNPSCTWQSRLLSTKAYVMINLLAIKMPQDSWLLFTAIH